MTGMLKGSMRAIALVMLLLFPAFLTSCQETTEADDMQSVLIELQVDAGNIQAIADAAQAVEDKVEEAGLTLANLQTYRLMPQLAAEVDGETALFLLSLDEVASLRPDRTKTIQE